MLWETRLPLDFLLSSAEIQEARKGDKPSGSGGTLGPYRVTGISGSFRILWKGQGRNSCSVSLPGGNIAWVVDTLDASLLKR